MSATPRIFAAAFVAVSLLLSSAGWAQVVTNPPTTPPSTPPRVCGLGKPLVGCPVGTRSDYYSPFGCTVGCSNSIVYCQNPTTAPVPDIECVGGDGGFVCYGSPQSMTAGLTYTWSGVNLTIDQPDGNRNPYVSVECRRGSAYGNLALTVTADGGGSRTVTKAINCIL